jgi:hypothetical protein
MRAGLAFWLAQLGREQGRWATRKASRAETFGLRRGKRKEKMERWRAGPAREYGPRGFWKILKTFLFSILIKIQI